MLPIDVLVVGLRYDDILDTASGGGATGVDHVMWCQAIYSVRSYAFAHRDKRRVLQCGVVCEKSNQTHASSMPPVGQENRAAEVQAVRIMSRETERPRGGAELVGGADLGL